MQGRLVRGLRRRVRRGVTWRPTTGGADPVDIASLIAPLRYDVVVRADFFDWVEPRLDQDPEEVARAAGDHPYAVWFRHIEVARFRPHLRHDEPALHKAFVDRVSRSAILLRSYLDRGFDATQPVTLRSTASSVHADSGLHVDKSLHVGDGGHRLALLLRDDRPLEPQMYVVDPRRMPVIDNTNVLVRHLKVSSSDYAHFLAPRYVGRKMDSLRQLEAAVARDAPHLLAELRAVIEAHIAAGVKR